MSKVALYFRRWKNYARQKNMDDDWGFTKELTELSENTDDNEKGTDYLDLEIFQVKFLGSTAVDAPQSEKVTAHAIKNIISAAKSTRRKLQRLNLSVCPKGIETFDTITGETLHRISIYKVSYCSADANHSNVFAFIAGSNDDDNTSNKCTPTDDLTCYAFLCAKRRIAYNLTVTVAKNFERAFDSWKRSEQIALQRFVSEKPHISNNATNQKHNDDSKRRNEFASVSNLIDLGTNSSNVSDTMQTSWVCFNDDSKGNSVNVLG